MTNEQILLPVAPPSESLGFLQIDQCRGIVEEVVFDRLGRPSFFDEAVEIVQRWVAATLQHRDPRTLPAEELLCLIQFEACSLFREIERRFAKTGKLGLPTTF
jgi:hypothetical protein